MLLSALPRPVPFSVGRDAVSDDRLTSRNRSDADSWEVADVLGTAGPRRSASRVSPRRRPRTAETIDSARSARTCRVHVARTSFVVWTWARRERTTWHAASLI